MTWLLEPAEENHVSGLFPLVDADNVPHQKETVVATFADSI